MFSASDAADWWDRQHAESKKVLDQYVDDNPGLFSVVVATTLATAMEVGAGTVDALRLGKGVAEKGVAGLGEDALRLISLPVVGGAVLGAGGRLAKTALGAVAKRIPKQAISAVAECPLAKRLAQLGKKVKAVLGKNLTGKSTPKYNECLVEGCPISMATGEELLAVEDFTWDGPLSLRWTRFYRSGQSGVDLQLGHGWLTPLDEWLEVSADGVSYHDAEGRAVELPLPEPGDYSLNLPEQLRLYREDGQYRLVGADGPARVFQGGAGRCRLARWQNEAGHCIEPVYDEHGQAQALRASWGKTLLIQRDGPRIAAIGPARRGEHAVPLVRYRYDAAGDLVGVLDRLDQGERYAYRNHVITRRTLASGFNFHFEWDSHTPTGRCVHNFGDHGIYDYHFAWTDSGISRATDSRGGVSEYMHTADGLLLWKTSPEGRTTRYAYDGRHLLCSVTDAKGATAYYTHDEEGRLATLVDPLGQTYRLAYNAAGQPVSLTDPLGQTWARAYDAQGRLVQTQDPQGGTTGFTYNAQGLAATVTDALRQTRTLLWDEQARLVGEIGFDGVRRRYQYDDDDRIAAVITEDRLATRYEYDAAGRVTAVTAPDGSVTRLAYNAAGLLARHTDAEGRATEYRYADGLAQISERIDPAGQVLRYAYDSERKLIGLSNAKGEAYRLNYDKDENLVEEIGFDGRVQRYRYDAAGHLEAHAQRGEPGRSPPDWQVTRFQRDPLGRALVKTGPDGTASEFAYDALGRLCQAKNSQIQLHFQYNALGQVIQEIQGGAAVAHEYDALGRRVATVAPGGQRVEYAYDLRGRLREVKLDGASLSQHSFDALGQEIARQQGDLVSRYAYDPVGRLQQHRAGLAGNKTAVLGRRYGYDAAGKLLAVDDIRQGQSRYVYDPADRLVQVDGLAPERFVHDPADNLVQVNQDGGGLVKGDRLLLLGDRHFSYDTAGNRVEERRGRDGRQLTRYAYDGDNRLLRVENPAGVSIYRYDPLGRRVAKQTALGETRFVYDGARLLQETQGERRRLYLFEPGGFRPLALVERAGPQQQDAVYYYHLDHLGTPREMTDGRGHIVWSAQYRAYGALAVADVALIDNPLRFQGQYCDAETGLHYNLNRYYDPAAGRFVGQDPIGLEGDINLYRYARNPVGWIDPLGLAPLSGVDFSGSPDLFPAAEGQSNIVQIEMQGSRGRDFTQAYKASGISAAEAEGYTWHHVNDFDSATGKTTMQLVKTPTHEATFPHKGSVAQYEQHFGVDYDTKASVAKSQKKGWLRGKPPCKL